MMGQVDPFRSFYALSKAMTHAPVNAIIAMTEAESGSLFNETSIVEIL